MILGMTPGVELVFILVVFLALLCVGMTIPFAILVPSVLYLLPHGGLAGLKGLGLVSWGSMDSFTLSAIPLFILMAEILQESRLSLAHLSRPVEAGRLDAGRTAADQYRGLRDLRRDLRLERGDGGLDRPCRAAANCSRATTVRGCRAGSLAAGGTLGILIPPSIAMIVYGTFTETSVAKLFMAGVDAGPAADRDVHVPTSRLHALVRPDDRADVDEEAFGERDRNGVRSTCCPSWC